MDPLPLEIERFVRSESLLHPRTGTLVAVSGGLDSVVLLDVLRRLASSVRGRLVVAHFDHRLRGRASKADRRFVVRMAERLGMECEVGEGDVLGLARSEGLSVEMAARRLRHAFLAAAARRQRLNTIALGHHADDQVELFWLRLLRGTSPSGLGGMLPAAASPCDARVRLVRPLLQQSRARLEQHAREVGLRWREDASNGHLDILRNRIRHRLLPGLERQYQPALRRIVLRLMDMLRAEHEVLEPGCKELRLHPRTKKPAGDDVPRAIERRRISGQLMALGIQPSFERIETLRVGTGRTAMAPGGRRLVYGEDGQVREQSAAVRAFRPDMAQVDLRKASGRLKFGDLSVSWQLVEGSEAIAPRGRGACESFDAETVGAGITLRHWQAGDRFQPIGFARAVKLQDFFTNRKVPAVERRRRVLAVDVRGRIFWVEGERISELHKLRPTTRRVLQWRARRSEG